MITYRCGRALSPKFTMLIKDLARRGAVGYRARERMFNSLGKASVFSQLQPPLPTPFKSPRLSSLWTLSCWRAAQSAWRGFASIWPSQRVLTSTLCTGHWPSTRTFKRQQWNCDEREEETDGSGKIGIHCSSDAHIFLTVFMPPVSPLPFNRMCMQTVEQMCLGHIISTIF